MSALKSMTDYAVGVVVYCVETLLTKNGHKEDVKYILQLGVN